MAKKELTAEQKAKMKVKEEKALAKAEARIAKAGGLIPYWIKMFEKQELNKDNDPGTLSLCEYGVGASTLALAFIGEDRGCSKTSTSSMLCKGIGIGIICFGMLDSVKGTYRYLKVISMSKDIELYGSKHPEEYNELVEYSREFVDYYVTRVYDHKSCLSQH